MSLQRLRKIQVHSNDLKVSNDKGENDFSAFSPTGVLQGDFWECSTDSVSVGDLILYKGNIVRALVDNPGDLTAENVAADKWAISRFSNGQTLVMRSEFFVNTSTNYNLATKHLTVFAFASTPFKDVDNINVYVNSGKYTLQHFTFQIGTNVVVWIPINSGFDLATGDFVEVEVFSQLRR